MKLINPITALRTLAGCAAGIAAVCAAAPSLKLINTIGR